MNTCVILYKLKFIRSYSNSNVNKQQNYKYIPINMHEYCYAGDDDKNLTTY